MRSVSPCQKCRCVSSNRRSSERHIVPHRAALMQALEGEDRYGIALIVQMGGVPNELQIILETAQYAPAVQGLRQTGGYIVRCLGVREHRAQVGVFARLQILDDHPLLYHHNTPRVAVHFEGKPANLHELVLDISQAYVSTFGPWRNVAEMGDDLNPELPLTDLLNTGYGLLGVMPKPLAQRMARVLEHHHLRASLSEEAGFEMVDEHGRSRLSKLLLIDRSYYIALDFSIETMTRVR